MFLSTELVILRLKSAGLVATKSNLDPRSIILGGARTINTNYGISYEDTFWLERINNDKYMARISGPGNLSEELEFSSNYEAVNWIIKVMKNKGFCK